MCGQFESLTHHNGLMSVVCAGESTPQLKEALEPATAEEGKHLFDLGEQQQEQQ